MTGRDEGKAAEKKGEQTEADDQLQDLPIDKGWAWVILFAISVNMSLSAGYLRGYGILFVEFLAVFEAPSSVTALVMGAQSIFLSLAGFVTMNIGLLYFRVRTITILAGVFLFVGIFLTSFATSIASLIVFQGLFVGVGCSMVNGPSLVLLNQYFVKRRALATSIATSGGTLGSVLIPLLMRKLLDEYHLQGALLVFSAIVLHIIVFGALLRPLEDYRARSQRRRRRQGGLQSAQSSALAEEEAEGNLSERLLHDDGEELRMKDVSRGSAGDVNGKRRSDLKHRSRESRTYELQSPHAKSEMSLIDRVATPSVVIYASLPDLPEAVYRANSTEQGVSTSVSSLTARNPSNGLRGTQHDSKTVEHSGEVTRVSVAARCWTTFCGIFDFSLLKRPDFWILLLYSMLGMMGALMMVIYLPALASFKGVSRADAALLLSINGAVVIVSRPVGGHVADVLSHRRVHLAAASMFLCGLAGMFTYFYNSFVTLLALSILHGLFGAIFVPIVPVLMVDILGIANLNKALGFTMLFHGSFLAVVHPFCGFLGDLTGSYDAVFLFLGSSTVLSVFILLLLPCAQRLAEKAKPGAV